jgi:uncharacterized protein YggU (UPF0235/DUF167 family)
MKINVKAKAGAREEKIDPPTQELWRAKKNSDSEGDNFITVSVKEPPVQGKANFAITAALAQYFGVSIYNVRLISGQTSKQKIFEIC